METNQLTEGVNAYGQPDRKLFLFFTTCPWIMIEKPPKSAGKCHICNSRVQGLGAWNYFLSFPEQYPQVLRAQNSIYMKFEQKNNIQAYNCVYHLCQKFVS